MTILACIVSLSVITVSIYPAQKARHVADTIIIHAKIYTENSHQPWAQVLAMAKGEITAVGGDEVFEHWRRRTTQIIDAGGRVVLPGFTDSHMHFLEGSLSLGWPNLNGAATVADLEKQLKEYAASHPGKDWVFGQGWTYDAFGSSVLADKRILDRIFPDRPVYLESYDGHTAWVNSKALTLAEIKPQTPDPATGIIVRDAITREPTGALKEDARHLVRKLVPTPTEEEKLAALRIGLRMAGQYGLVRMHLAGEAADTFGDSFDLGIYDRLRRQGQLTARFYFSGMIDPPALAQAEVLFLEEARRRYHDEWLSVGAAKFFLDGAIETHTAAMLTPYSDLPSVTGTTLWSPEDFNRAVIELDRRGFQIFTHATGDRGVRMALDAYEQAHKMNGRMDARHRVEHVETVSASDVPRFGSLGVVASMQPLHAYPQPNIDVWLRSVGPERGRLAWAWHSLANAGAPLAFGSDWEVVTMNPWPGVQTAVTRQDDKGNPPGGWIPEQRLTVEQAIAAYTMGGAYAGHREQTEGSLEPGKVADLIIISQNPFEVDPHELSKTTVMLTMVGGRVVFHRTPGPVITNAESEAPER